MKPPTSAVVLFASLFTVAACSDKGEIVGPSGVQSGARVFVSSATNGNRPTNARDRIGAGPWTNVNGVVVADTIEGLHARRGDFTVFVDERGERIPGQWPGTPAPVQHDILTGSNADGTLMTGATCADWTSDSAALRAQVGHSDGMGPNQST